MAFRYKAGGNSVRLVTSSSGEQEPISKELCSNNSYSELWAEPQPGRDEGIALIGKRIRCAFPKAILNESFEGLKPATRILEGEVINVIDWTGQLEARQMGRQVATRIELLIDQTQLELLPFLSRKDPVIDFESLPDAAKKGFAMEERIRGKNKAVVEVRLSDIMGRSPSNSTNPAKIEAKWVIRKRVPSKLPAPALALGSGSSNGSAIDKDGVVSKVKVDDGITGKDLDPNQVPGKEGPEIVDDQNGTQKKPKRSYKKNQIKDAASSWHVGDGNDSQEQQEKNWRWLASRYDNLRLFQERPIPHDYVEYLSFNFIGEVIKVVPQSSSDTLAMVTVRRLCLPEHTLSGRMQRHGPYEAFDDDDSVLGNYTAAINPEAQKAIFYRVPVEELVIVSKRVARDFTTAPDQMSSADEMQVMYSYSLGNDTCTPSLDPNENHSNQKIKYPTRCHRCRRIVYRSKDLNGATWWCKPCTRTLKSTIDTDASSPNKDAIEMTEICDCQNCIDFRRNRLEKAFSTSLKRARDQSSTSNGTEPGLFSGSNGIVNAMEKVPFDLPPSFLPEQQTVFKKMNAKVKAKAPKLPKKLQAPTVAAKTETKPRKSKTIPDSSVPSSSKKIKHETPTSTLNKEPQVEELEFRESSARLFAYEPSKRKFLVSQQELYPWTIPTISKDKPRNLRQQDKKKSGEKKEREEKVNSRAARASQRRLVKAVAAIGMSLDTLGSREQVLRFDRSGIHAWGVFADEDLKEGELLLEYRGEIIGNAMAEKREKEYEDAKIGSDYMFRIDGDIVCDATKQGNVARFINASCDPNCYTKIINMDGTKRIVIYAKKDIPAGDELCYDYKFPLEYDEEKRIPCHCGARNCRGYMNWDKKYVAVATATNPPPLLTSPLHAIKQVQTGSSNSADKQRASDGTNEMETDHKPKRLFEHHVNVTTEDI